MEVWVHHLQEAIHNTTETEMLEPEDTKDQPQHQLVECSSTISKDSLQFGTMEVTVKEVTTMEVTTREEEVIRPRMVTT